MYIYHLVTIISLDSSFISDFALLKNNRSVMATEGRTEVFFTEGSKQRAKSDCFLPGIQRVHLPEKDLI